MISKAYGKINLSLKVLGKRDDGYHDLDMLMINISLHDLIIYKKTKQGLNVSCNKQVCEMKDNIVYKVAKIIFEKYNIESGIKIHIIKKIPDGGGLGGGSSDAANTILSLNKIFKLNMQIGEMIEIASMVGSDVPFFLFNSFSRVKGRGEIVEKLNKVFNEKLLLVIPNIKCSTREVYSKAFYESNNTIDDALINDNFFNDLEQASISAYPCYQLEKIKNILIRSGAKQALMSGSGSTIFGIFNNYKNITNIKKELSDCKLIKCKTISCCKKSLREYN